MHFFHDYTPASIFFFLKKSGEIINHRWKHDTPALSDKHGTPALSNKHDTPALSD